MKKVLLLIISVAVGVATQAQTAEQKLAQNQTMISLADARSKIDKAIDSPKVMAEIMKRLSAADQLKFLGEVNKAIGEMPASLEEKSAKYLNLNSVAVTSAQPGNSTAMIAEVFATVPPEALTVINERFAIDLLNRASNPDVTYTDEKFREIAVNIMKKVNERTAETENGSARSAFAMVMLVRASNGSPADLADSLIETLEHDDAKEMAKNEWLPAALGKDGNGRGYEPLLASADAGRRPDFDFTLVIAGPQYYESVLEDIVGKNTDQMALIETHTPVLDAVENRLVHQVPTLGADVVGAAGAAGDGVTGAVVEGDTRPTKEPTEPEPEPEPTPDPPVPYYGQSIY